MNGLVIADGVGVAIDREVLLAPVSFDLDAGEALAVVGPNGAGKTTLLRVLAGLTAPTTGQARIAGAPPDERDRASRARVATLIGLPPMARSLTVREHLTLVGASWGASVTESQDRAAARLAELGIAGLGARFPHELSTGQTQLVALALTLSRPCDVLLLDEPEQRLDTDRVDLVGDVLRGLVEGGTTLVLASHSSILVERVADRALPITGAGRVDGD